MARNVLLLTFEPWANLTNIARVDQQNTLIKGSVNMRRTEKLIKPLLITDKCLIKYIFFEK